MFPDAKCCSFLSVLSSRQAEKILHISISMSVPPSDNFLVSIESIIDECNRDVNTVFDADAVHRFCSTNEIETFSDFIDALRRIPTKQKLIQELRGETQFIKEILARGFTVDGAAVSSKPFIGLDQSALLRICAQQLHQNERLEKKVEDQDTQIQELQRQTHQQHQVHAERQFRMESEYKKQISQCELREEQVKNQLKAMSASANIAMKSNNLHPKYNSCSDKNWSNIKSNDCNKFINTNKDNSLSRNITTGRNSNASRSN